MTTLTAHQQNQQNNHPKKGDRIKVEPIRRPEDIKAIKQMLESKPRDYLLFVMGINTGLRAGDLLQLRAGSFRNVRLEDKIPIREQKTGKAQEIIINKPIRRALSKYFTNIEPQDEDYLFKSRKGNNNPMTVNGVNLLVKQWCRDINLEGNYGSHTLRKTFGYQLRRKYGVSWEILASKFNHSSPSVTRSYLGIQDDEVNNILVHCPI